MTDTPHSERTDKEGHAMHRFAVLAAAVAATAIAVTATTASATAPPVGPLPPGKVTQVSAPAGTYIGVVLPRRSNGLVWRLARSVDPKVLKQTSEADVGTNVVIVFRAMRAGNVKVVFALTRGERSHVFATVTHVVRVR